VTIALGRRRPWIGRAVVFRFSGAPQMVTASRRWLPFCGSTVDGGGKREIVS